MVQLAVMKIEKDEEIISALVSRRLCSVLVFFKVQKYF